MASDLVPSVSQDTPAKTCAFKLEDDSKCPSIKVFARGYCEKHYRSLKRAGAFGPDSPRPLRKVTPPTLIMENVASVRRARRALLKAAPTFVDHLLTASHNAAREGDAGPAQWAILHTRTLQPVAAQAAQQSGMTVNVGIKVEGSSQNSPV